MRLVFNNFTASSAYSKVPGVSSNLVVGAFLSKVCVCKITFTFGNFENILEHKIALRDGLYPPRDEVCILLFSQSTFLTKTISRIPKSFLLLPRAVIRKELPLTLTAK